MRSLFLVILSLFAISSCSNETKPEREYEKFLSELTSVSVQDSLRIESARTPVHTPIRMATDDQGRVIIANGINWTLHLMDKEGNFLAHTGGSGRGPDEYTAINQINVGVDNQLYVYDARSRDITSYEVVNNEFQLQKELAVPSYDNSILLEAIYKQDQGYIGVFKTLGVADYTFKVYRLNENLQLQNLLLEMPGNETYTFRGSTRDNFLGRTTEWAVDGRYFFYSSTDNLSISSVDLQNGSRSQFDFSYVPKPRKGKKEIEDLEAWYRPIIQNNPKLREIIREGDYLTYFRNFLTNQNYFYYTLRRLGKAKGIILRINKKTEEMDKIEVPPRFFLHAVQGNILYGIDRTDRKNDIMILKL